MPPRIASPQTAPASATAPPATTTAAAAAAPPRQQQAAAPPPQQSYSASAPSRDDEGVAKQEGDTTTAAASSYPRYDSFGPLTPGGYTFVCSVSKVVRWPFGTQVSFRVEFGPERGRDIGWGQTPPSQMSADGQRVWRSTLFGAYAAGGWPLDPVPETGWGGWEKNGAGVALPPYDRCFVYVAPDGVHVPVLLEVNLNLDAAPYDKFPKIRVVKHYMPPGATAPIQGPLPYQLPQWLADLHKWRGTPTTITTKDAVIPLIKLDYKQVPYNHGGLVHMRDLVE